MAKRELSPAALAVVQAVRTGLVGWRDAPNQILDVCVACSGGADSLALAAALAWLDAHEPDPLRRSSAMVVDHGLQPDSAAVAAGVTGVLKQLGLPAEVVRVHVAAGQDGLEAAAREARYAALTSGDADIVLLGHTMDDQAETVLLGLARGSGARSLAGMPRRWLMPGTDGSVALLRPLLELRRAVTRQACADWGLQPWDDPMNDDDRFSRVRARRLLPVLDEALGPGIVESLSRSAALARDDADYFDALVKFLGGPFGAELSVEVVSGLAPALRGRMVRRWLEAQGVLQLSYERTQAVLALVTDWRGQAGVDLPGGRRVIRRGGVLLVDQRPGYGGAAGG